MNNEFLNQLNELITAFKEHHEDVFAPVEIAKTSECDFCEENKQNSNFKHELIEDTEYVSQPTLNALGDCLTGVILQKIKGSHYCLLMEYSTPVAIKPRFTTLGD